MNKDDSKQKVLIFIVSYNASNTITSVLERIPQSLFTNEAYNSEVLIIDDCSSDDTFEVGHNFTKEFDRFPFKIWKNPENQGYGGNQKLGYTYAINNDFDHVILLHGDGQYAPEVLPELVTPLVKKEADAVFGSRMIVKGDAIKGGMPLYKYYGNKILTKIENTIAGSDLSEYHSGLRLYSVSALKQIAFQKNSNDFDFDTDIILQFTQAKFKIKEIPIPTHYGDEVCHVNGLKYAFDILCNCIHFQVQKLGIFYHPKFDFKKASKLSKLNFESSHSKALEKIETSDSILAIGILHEDVINELKSKASKFKFIDIKNVGELDSIEETFDKILLFDCIEQVASAEKFLKQIANLKSVAKSKILIYSGNIGFFPVRLMLLLGFFHYSNIGILNFNHKRFFTFISLKNLLNQNGYKVLEQKGIPAPYPLALKNKTLANTLLKINSFFTKISKSLFAYQMEFEVHALPTVQNLLNNAMVFSENKIKQVNGDK